MKKWVLTTFYCTFLTAQLSWSPPTSISSSSVDASDPQIVMDTNGNVTACWIENGYVKANTLPFNGSWSTTRTISGSNSSLPKLTVDGNNNVTAIWSQNSIIQTSTLPLNGSWSTALSLSSTGVSSSALYSNSTGDLIAIWSRGGIIEAIKKPYGGSWSSVTQLSNTNSDNARAAINQSGQIIAIWHTSNSGNDQIYSSSSTIGGTWGTATNITNNSSLSNNYPRITIDNNGNSYALWYQYDFNGTDYLNVSILFSTLPINDTWAPSTTLVSGGCFNPANLKSKIKVDPSGNALAIWTNSYDNFTFNIESAIMPFGGTWAITKNVIANLYAYDVDAALNDAERLVSVYMFFDGENCTINASETNFSGPFANIWSPPVLVSQNTNNCCPKVTTTFLSNLNQIQAASTWLTSNNGIIALQTSIGSVTLLNPPTNLSLVQTANDLGVFQDYINTLTWTASTSPNLLAYAIYRNGIHLIDVGNLDVLEVAQHNQSENTPVTYGIIAIDNTGTQSPMVTISLP